MHHCQNYSKSASDTSKFQGITSTFGAFLLVMGRLIFMGEWYKKILVNKKEKNFMNLFYDLVMISLSQHTLGEKT